MKGVMYYLNKLTGKSEPQNGIGGAAMVYGLARKAVVQGAGTYSATEIVGYRVLVAGTTDWTIDPIDSAIAVVPAAAMVVGQVYPEHLTSITVGTGGSALLYLS